MKAAQVNKYGTADIIEINENAKTPTLGSDQILVSVHATSLNPFDGAILSGYAAQMIKVPFPITPGGDFAGIVKDANGSADFKVGDEVYGQSLIVNGGSGSLAEFAAANTKNVAQKPKNIDFVSAASLPLVGASAIQALEDSIKLQKGQKILIHGGAGGIGSIAVQLAKALGAYVATTVGTDDIEFVKNLGADEVINYKNQDFEKIVKGFDAVYTTVGGDVIDKSFKVLKAGGIIVSMLGAPSEELAKKYGVTAIGQSTNITAELLSRLAKYVEAGKIKPQVDKVFALKQTREAFKHLEEGHPRGKVVVKIEK